MSDILTMFEAPPITFLDRLLYRFLGRVPQGYTLIQCCEYPVLAPTSDLMNNLGLPSLIILTATWKSYRWDGANEYIARDGGCIDAYHFVAARDQISRFLERKRKAEQLWS